MILLIGKYLRDVTFFQQCSTKYIRIWSSKSSDIISLSSTLTKLTITVATFDDCLYLNGCLQSLSTLIIRIIEITRSSSKIDNTVRINAIIEYKQICR